MFVINHKETPVYVKDDRSSTFGFRWDYISSASVFASITEAQNYIDNNSFLTFSAEVPCL